MGAFDEIKLKIAQVRNRVDPLIKQAFTQTDVSPREFLRNNNVTSEQLEDAYNRRQLTRDEYIQTEYVSPEQMAARSTSEIFNYTDRNGKRHTIMNSQAGVLSPADPIGSFYVAGEVLGPALKLIGKGALWGAGRAGNNWAKGKIISDTMNKAISKRLSSSTGRTISVIHNDPIQSTRTKSGIMLGTPKTKTYTLYNQFGEPIAKSTIGEGSQVGSSQVAMISSKNGGRGVTEDIYNFDSRDYRRCSYRIRRQID